MVGMYKTVLPLTVKLDRLFVNSVEQYVYAFYINSTYIYTYQPVLIIHLGPVVQSVVSLTSSLRVILLTVLADSIYNILIFFAEKCE